MERLAQDETACARPAGVALRMVPQIGICAIGLLLVVAALLKAASPYELATLRQAYELPLGLIVAVIVVEAALGAALLAGVRARAIWLATVALFAVFAVFSLYRVVAGYESCGCFGPVKVHPLLTFSLDMTVVAGLTALRGQFPAFAGSNSKSRAFHWSIACLVLIGLAGAIMQKVQPTLAHGGIDDGRDGGGLVILEPETWIGQEFTLSKRLSPQVDLSRDDWVVVFFHHDCPKCQEALPRYEALAAELDARRTRTQVLLVEVPPYGPSAAAGVARHARLSDRTEWFVQAPFEIVVANGIVQSASLDLPSIARIP